MNTDVSLRASAPRSSLQRPLSGLLGRAALIACAAFVLACGKSDGPFTPCVASADCSGGRQCLTLTSGAGVCLETCPTGQALCAGGQACVEPTLAGEEWVCLPGGNVALGGVCSRSVDCELSGVCVTESAFTVCRRACDPRAPICGAGTQCNAWTAERGYCTPILAPADMGMAVPTDGG